ncbi:DUF805 domain-containing protein [Lactococcus allomyrinae]|uniref:DUF805 domain-containing protein n=1 Tax=Lactococcus allomyrinae TaxID=2419773 RepID=A0A387BPX9_9LACT|nr:DUF805 domain-containing protein [Lactococcus allomyrinae]AYG00561.1 DUF805 domain-containing protein [Lactococcus allomyrinae]
MIKAYIKYWKKSFDFQSYSSRSDYWWVFLVNAIIFAILNGIRFFTMIPQVSEVLGKSSSLSQNEMGQKVLDLSLKPTGSLLAVSVIIAIVGLIVLIPNTSLTARRLSDAGMPWWIAIIFGLSAFIVVINSFIHNSFLGNLGLLFNIITLITYILCIFPTKYKEDEEDDSRIYE